jgi:coenzyme Q-binding protein COQ10|tara:strand:- start:5204 stop:5956 length:753 start_codon:yes stop_codon:yes gene_type:complete
LDIKEGGKNVSSLDKVPLCKVPSNQRTIFSAAKDALFGGDKKNNGGSSSSSSSDEKNNKKDDEDSSLLKRKFSSRKIVRDVAPAELFAIVADVNKYHEFLPFCRRSKVTHEIDKDRFEAELEIGFKVFNERYTSRVTLDRPRKVVAEDKSNEEDGGGALFEKMKTVWRFRELEEEEEEDVNDVESRKENEEKLTRQKKNVSTVVDFEIAFKVKSSAHAAALSVFFEDVANTQIQAFEKRCRSLMSLPSAE